MIRLFDGWCRIAVTLFGLAPSAFWAMPVREWLNLLEGARAPGFDRAALDDLLTQFPDLGGPHDPD